MVGRIPGTGLGLHLEREESLFTTEPLGQNRNPCGGGGHVLWFKEKQADFDRFTSDEEDETSDTL